MTDPQADIKSNAARINELNATVRYTMWSVFKLERTFGPDSAAARKAEAAEVEQLLADLAGEDVVVRGIYDVAGLRADADLMVWWHARSSNQLQRAYHRLRSTASGARLTPVWSQMALHRPA